MHGSLATFWRPKCFPQHAEQGTVYRVQVASTHQLWPSAVSYIYPGKSPWVADRYIAGVEGRSTPPLTEWVTHCHQGHNHLFRRNLCHFLCHVNMSPYLNVEAIYVLGVSRYIIFHVTFVYRKPMSVDQSDPGQHTDQVGFEHRPSTERDRNCTCWVVGLNITCDRNCTCWTVGSINRHLMNIKLYSICISG